MQLEFIDLSFSPTLLLYGLDKLYGLRGPQFPHLTNEDNITRYMETEEERITTDASGSHAQEFGLDARRLAVGAVMR